MSDMTRGEMIRRLDEASRDVHDHLANGPLTPRERHTLAASLERLLPAVANSLQAEEDQRAADALQPHTDTGTSAPVSRRGSR